MALFFDDMLLSEIRERNDIVDIVSMYTDLKGAGNRYTGLCPFHREKTPSFFVNKEDQLFYCFGCHEGGNIINFVEKINNLDFVEAVKYLAERGGVPLPEEDGTVSKEYRLKKTIYDINKSAAMIFHNNLKKNKEALEYLTNRGLDIKTIKNFGLGFAENKYSSLYEQLRKEGFSEDDIVKSGVVSKKDKNVYDFFRNRIIFPVIDLRGNVIAFGGRVMDNSLPKYLNTGDTEAFKKRQNLFALNLAKNSGKDYIILAEGYMDVISLYQYGFNNAVASLGTSFCEEHARLIKRYTKKVIICYDGDEAGQKAVDKAAEYLIAENVAVSVARLKGGKDPDEILKKFGNDYFNNILKSSTPYMEYLLEKERENIDIEGMEGKVSYAKAATTHLSKINDPLERELYIKKLSKELDISEDIIRNEYQKQTLSVRKKEEKKQEIKEKYQLKAQPDTVKIENNLKVCEGELVNIMINSPVYYKKLKKYINENYFSFGLYNKVIKLIDELLEEKGGYDINMIVDRLPQNEKGSIAMLKLKELKYEIDDKTVNELLRRIEHLKNKSRLNSADSLEDLKAQLERMKKRGV